MALEEGSLFTHIHRGVATVQFGHPAGNSFPMKLLKKLTKELHLLSQHPEVRVIVLRSEGDRAFCAGASFNELIAISNEEEGTLFFSGFAHVINAMRTCSKLIIGRVQGKAVGGGVGLVAACDYVFATRNASVKLSEFTIGIGPFVIAPAVERKIGVSGLAELTLAATNWKDAHWAKEKGLYAEVFENMSDMDKGIDVFANELASYNPEALRKMKKVLWEHTDHWRELLVERAAVSGQLVLSDVTKRALEQFKK